jgi:tRNA dimethylallyltransferase
MTLAQQLNTVILSADSRQIYRGFDIGTAKPSPAERARVPHFLIDLCDPTETLTLAQYQAQANQAIAQCHAQGQIPLLVGGTGLYIKGVVRGLIMPKVPPQPELRSQLAALGQPHCYQLLRQVDPIAAEKIHANDASRTLRALEVYYATGSPLSAQQGENPPDYRILQLGLGGPVDWLDRRIAQRVDQMIAQGLVQEVQTLVHRYGEDLPLLQTLGYGELLPHLRGEWTLAESREAIVLHTRQFAKRQRTWFRQDPAIQWLDLSQPDWQAQGQRKITTFLRTLA